MTFKILSALRSVGAVLAGFAVIAVGTTLTFTVLLDGISYHESSLAELTIATIGALASGLAGGFVAGWLARRHPLWHAGALVIPISLDTGSILLFDASADPWWFDLGGGATLLLGAVVAGYLLKTRLKSQRVSTA